MSSTSFENEQMVLKCILFHILKLTKTVMKHKDVPRLKCVFDESTWAFVPSSESDENDMLEMINK